MKVFDFNIHLPYTLDKKVDDIIVDEKTLDNNGLIKAFDHHYNELKSLDGMNLMLFNIELFSQSKPQGFIDHVGQKSQNVMMTALMDFRSPEIADRIKLASASKVKAIKFHPYIQKIEEKDFADVHAACEVAQSENMMICVDASYGTTKMYQYDNLKLICYLADRITQVPIIILHSGGARCLEAMLIALEKDNIYIETSFSLPFYKGSSIDTDLAFCYKKVGAERVLFASDFPMYYQSTEKGVAAMLDFLQRHNFKDRWIEKIMYENAMTLLER